MLNFPDPSVETEYTDPDTGVEWTFDGVGWVQKIGVNVSGGGGGDCNIPILNSPPANPELGERFFSSSDGYMYIWYGSEWVAIGGAGGGEGLLDDMGNLVIDGNVDAVTTTGRLKEAGSVDSLTVINCSLSNNFMTTLSEDTAFSFTQVPSKELSGVKRFIDVTNTFYELELWIQQDADASGYSVSWPSSIKWLDDKEPDLSTDADSVSVIGLSTADGGATWFGRSLSGGYSSGGGDGGGNGRNEILIVAGGGSGGGGRFNHYGGGGGGAGGVRYFNGLDSNYFARGVTIDVVVGAGGAAVGSSSVGNNGGNSSILQSAEGITHVASGGGGGGGVYTAGGNDGGSGGGMGQSGQQPAGSGNVPPTSPPQGYNGNNYGGGGAGGLGDAYLNSGDGSGQGGADPTRPTANGGGPAIISDITGTFEYYAAGGGQGQHRAGLGGTGHGGFHQPNPLPSEAGRDGYGDGGGGGFHQPSNAGVQAGAAGGSGVVIVRTTQVALTTTGDPVITTVGEETVYKFLSDGSLTF